MDYESHPTDEKKETDDVVPSAATTQPLQLSESSAPLSSDTAVEDKSELSHHNGENSMMIDMDSNDVKENDTPIVMRTDSSRFLEETSDAKPTIDSQEPSVAMDSTTEGTVLLDESVSPVKNEVDLITDNMSASMSGPEENVTTETLNADSIAEEPNT